MPVIILSQAWPKKIDGSIKAKAMTFLQKLQEDDTTPGLHVEPISKAVDDRVRTGRVDQFWRAVMFRLDAGGETHYVMHGVLPHDEAVAVAGRVRLTVNPVNGLPQFEEVAETPPTPVTPPSPGLADTRETPKSYLAERGFERVDLVDTLGLSGDVVDAALAAPTDVDLLELAQQQEGWMQLILQELAFGTALSDIIAKLDIAEPVNAGDADAQVLESMQRPAARAQFAFIGDQDELRRVIESGDFTAWRVFLHPEQRHSVDMRTSGATRISGGAGTGKTVVLLHRARRLAEEDPEARIVLTTFTANLADQLQDSLLELDRGIRLAKQVGQPGVRVVGVDALASSVLRHAEPAELTDAVVEVLGHDRSDVSSRTPGNRWGQIVEDASGEVPPELVNESFLVSEYVLVVLPNRIRTLDEYLRIRRPGRGLALDRSKRTAVWKLIEAYRARCRVDGSLDFAEAAAVAAAVTEKGGTPVDHVLVDEGQDLHPTHWQLLRALVREGPDDLFIAEDSHQRIYGSRVVLGRYGIKIVGRSRRLTLNYRTTAENLAYAMSVLQDASYRDLEDEPEATGYRSARSGPVPRLEDVGSLDQEIDELVDQLRAWRDEGVAADTMAVLVPDRYKRDRVVKAIGDAQIPVVAVDRERPPAGKVPVMTMHRAKGTEFSRVVLVDVGFESQAERERLKVMDQAERADAELRRRSLVYVAATRARDELVVLRR